MKKSSILNDVLGPVMAGPSSSHTAGPGKIGLAVRSMWGKKIRNVDVVYEQGGSYPSGMRSLIPLDETIQTMLRVGQMLPRELCCTCEGGLCTTPTGLHLAQAVKERQQT